MYSFFSLSEKDWWSILFATTLPLLTYSWDVSSVKELLYLLNKIRYSCKLKWCDWSWGTNCYIISTTYCFFSFLEKDGWSILCHNTSFVNKFHQRCVFFWRIFIYYIQLDTHENWNCVIGVKEQVVTLFLLSIFYRFGCFVVTPL